MTNTVAGYTLSTRFKYNKDNTVCTLKYASYDRTIHLQICGIANLHAGDHFDIHEGEYYAKAKAMRKLAKKLCEILSYLGENCFPKSQTKYWKGVYRRNDKLLKRKTF